MSNKKPNLTNSQLNILAQWMHTRCNLDLSHDSGTFKKVVQIFGISRRRIFAIWKEAKGQILQGMPIFIQNKKKCLKRAARIPLPIERIKAIGFEDKSTIRDLADELGDVSKTIVGHWVKEKKIRAHTNSVHPVITDAHKIKRLTFCVQALYVDRSLGVLKFKTMFWTVHIDEKWFFLKKLTSRGYITQCEQISYRVVENKRYVTKVMFLCCVGRPIYEGTICVFDGKIGIFPFTVQVPAQRRSKNRPAGTLELKAQSSITKNVLKHALINKVIPAIKAKWPIGYHRVINIQQDNAKPHIKNSDPDFRAATEADGFDIRLVCQPPKSPDLNINALGWFRSLQSLQLKRKTFTVEQLVERVINSFDILSHETLNKVYLSLQCYMIEIMKVRGHNNFVALHMGKNALIRQGILPIDLEVDKELGKDCLYYLMQLGRTAGLEQLMEDLEVVDSGIDLNI